MKRFGIHQWMISFVCFLGVFAFSQKVDHLSYQRDIDASNETAMKSSLIRREEDLFQEMLVLLKSGKQKKAQEAAAKYLKEFPVGRYYYEAYRVFRAQVTKL